MELIGIKDIDNIIFDYKYQIEHTEKFNKCLDLIKKNYYNIFDKITTKKIIGDKIIMYKCIKNDIIIIQSTSKIIEEEGVHIAYYSAIINNKYYFNKNKMLREKNKTLIYDKNKKPNMLYFI